MDKREQLSNIHTEAPVSNLECKQYQKHIFIKTFINFKLAIAIFTRTVFKRRLVVLAWVLNTLEYRIE
jgi:hypothetical protein